MWQELYEYVVYVCSTYKLISCLIRVGGWGMVVWYKQKWPRPAEHTWIATRGPENETLNATRAGPADVGTLVFGEPRDGENTGGGEPNEDGEGW